MARIALDRVLPPVELRLVALAVGAPAEVIIAHGVSHGGDGVVRPAHARLLPGARGRVRSGRGGCGPRLDVGAAGGLCAVVIGVAAAERCAVGGHGNGALAGELAVALVD